MSGCQLSVKSSHSPVFKHTALGQDPALGLAFALTQGKAAYIFLENGIREYFCIFQNYCNIHKWLEEANALQTSWRS